METILTYSLTTEQQQKWTDFLKKSDHDHPRQHHTMSQIEIAKGRVPVFAIGTANDQIVAVGLFSIRTFWFGGHCSLEATCLSGPVFDDPTCLAPFLEQVIEFFKQIRVGRISVTPYWFYPDADVVKDIFMKMQFKPRRERIPTGFIDLRRSEEEIIASFSKNGRKKLRRLEGHPIKIYPIMQLEDSLPLYHCLQKMRAERKIYPMLWNEFKGTFRWTQDNPLLGCCLRADYEKTFIAGMFLKYGTKHAHGLAYAINNEEQRKLPKISLGFSLWWQVILWLQKQGSLYYDVDVYDENAESSDPLCAVYQFKRQFKPVQVYRIEPLIYDYKSPLCALLKTVVIMKKIKYHLKSKIYAIRKRDSNIKDQPSEQNEEKME